MVRQLVRILLIGLLAFLGLGIVQKWDFFISSWLGRSEPSAGLSDEQRAEAADTVGQTLTLMRHYYASGGDPRFSDRMPASEGVIAEMQVDVDYLLNAGLRQEPILQGLEILDVQTLGDTQVEVRTKEYWIHRFQGLPSEEPMVEVAEPTRSQILWGRYLVILRSTGWHVEAMEFATADELASGQPAEPLAGEGAVEVE